MSWLKKAWDHAVDETEKQADKDWKSVENAARYANGINLLQDVPAMTLGNHIYVSTSFEELNVHNAWTHDDGSYIECYVIGKDKGWCDLRILAHELQHCYQCLVVGGRSAA